MPAGWEGWQPVILVLGGAFSIAIALLSAVIAAARKHIGTRTKITVREELDRQMGPVQLELRTMNGEMGRTTEAMTRLTSKVENGLTHRQERIEERVDQIMAHLVKTQNRAE